ncbi:MAG: helix-turn-helix domain-containing protein [Acidobacteriales bacterium]|nr:helix-turn-helix domain-containing protein [Terriglobales bacterium]
MEDRPPGKPWHRAMLGNEIRKARLAVKLSQEELAFKADISRNYVSLLELNQKSPTVDVLLRIARALGIRASSLISAIEVKVDRPRGRGSH